MTNTVHIVTKPGLRMEIRGPDEDGEHRITHLQLDRVYAQLLARRLLQLAGNDKEFPDPSMGESVFAKALNARGADQANLQQKHRGSTRTIKVSRR